MATIHTADTALSRGPTSPGYWTIGNLGGFIGGISPENILHHTPAARNLMLVDALTKLRVVNRSKLGVQRMFSALLIEGKEPPIIVEQGEAVKVTFLAGQLSVPFRAFVAEEGRQGRLLSVDHLLILHYLLHHPEVTSFEVARLCQRTEAEARKVLSEMERSYGYLERGGTGKGTYWSLYADLHRRIAAARGSDRDRWTDWESAKTRVLSILKQRGEQGLSNTEIRRITRFDRNQVFRLMHELMRENPTVQLTGRGRYARYIHQL